RLGRTPPARTCLCKTERAQPVPRLFNRLLFGYRAMSILSDSLGYRATDRPQSAGVGVPLEMNQVLGLGVVGLQAVHVPVMTVGTVGAAAGIRSERHPAGFARSQKVKQRLGATGDLSLRQMAERAALPLFQHLLPANVHQATEGNQHAHQR